MACRTYVFALFANTDYFFTSETGREKNYPYQRIKVGRKCIFWCLLKQIIHQNFTDLILREEIGLSETAVKKNSFSLYHLAFKKKNLKQNKSCGARTGSKSPCRSTPPPGCRSSSGAERGWRCHRSRDSRCTVAEGGTLVLILFFVFNLTTDLLYIHTDSGPHLHRTSELS